MDITDECITDWLKLNLVSGDDIDHVIVSDILDRFVSDNKEIMISNEKISISLGRIMPVVFETAKKKKKRRKCPPYYTGLKWITSNICYPKISVIKLYDNKGDEEAIPNIIEVEENEIESIIGEVKSCEDEQKPLDENITNIIEVEENKEFESFEKGDDEDGINKDIFEFQENMTLEDTEDTENSFDMDHNLDYNLINDNSFNEEGNDGLQKDAVGESAHLEKPMDIRSYFMSKTDTFPLLAEEEENKLEAKRVKYREEEKEHENFNFFVFSRHCHLQEVRSLTPKNMPTSLSSLENVISLNLPQPIFMDEKRSIIYDESANFRTEYEKQVKSFLCSSFLPIKSGTVVSQAYTSTTLGDLFPQFTMLMGAKLKFKCQICEPYLIWSLGKLKDVKGVNSIFEGFRQVYTHFVSKHHFKALNWWSSCYVSSPFNSENVKPKNNNENQKIVDFFEVKSSSTTIQVPCSYLWRGDIVEQFKDDISIRRKQQKSLFRDKQLWTGCNSKKGHESCTSYKEWKKNHPNEYKILSNELNSSSRSVYVPGNHSILVSGKSVTLNGGIKSLDPLCTGKAITSGEHPYTCKNCNKQIPELKNVMNKRKVASLNKQESRVGKPGFRRDYASKPETIDTLSKLTEENRNLTNHVASFKRFYLSRRSWEGMIMESCQNDNHEKLIIDLLSLFNQPKSNNNFIQFEVIRNIVGKLKSGANHKFTDLIKDISILHKNRLGTANYSLIQNLFGLPGKTTASAHMKEEKLQLGMNMHVFVKGIKFYQDQPVVDCTDEARILRYITPVLSNGNIELVGQCFNPSIYEWEENRVILPKASENFIDDFSALKDYIDNIVKNSLLAKSCGIHNFSALTGNTNKPLIYLVWPTPNAGYTAVKMLEIWDKVRYHCFVDENKNLRENPISLLGHSSDSAGFQLSAASLLMTPCRALIDEGIKYLTLGLGETKFAAPYLSELPSIAYLDYDHEIRLLFKCLKYETLDLTIWEGEMYISIDHLKELKQVLSNIGTHCPFTDGDLLFARYLDQNCDAALKVFTKNVANLLEQHILGSEGTVLYIRAVVELLAPFITPSNNPNEMQQSLSTGITVLRLWKKIVQLKKWRLTSAPGAKFNPSKRGKFLTYGCSKTAEILFAAGTCHMLAMKAHFSHLSSTASAPYKAGTRTTERIISCLQGKTTQIQCLDAQPTLGDVLIRVSNVQVNQLAEERLIVSGAKRASTSNRKRISMNHKRMVDETSTYTYPPSYSDFLEEQRASHLKGVQEGKKLFSKYCKKGVEFLKKKKMWNFLEQSKCEIPEESQFNGVLPQGYAKYMLLNIESSKYLVSYDNDSEDEDLEEEEEDFFEESSDDSILDEMDIDDDKHDSDGKNVWFISRMVNGELKKIHILRAIKIHLARENISRERSKRHIAANFLPGQAPIDVNHDIIKYRFILFDSNMSPSIGKVMSLQKDGKNIISASTINDNAQMRVLLFEPIEESQHHYTVTSPATISKWLSISNVYGEVSLQYNEESKTYQLCDKSKLNYDRILKSLQSRSDFQMAKQLSSASLSMDYEVVEDIVEKRFDIKTHSLLYKVKFANSNGNDSLWLPMSSFSEIFKFNARGNKKFTCASGKTNLYAIKDTIEPAPYKPKPKKDTKISCSKIKIETLKKLSYFVKDSKAENELQLQDSCDGKDKAITKITEKKTPKVKRKAVYPISKAPSKDRKLGSKPQQQEQKSSEAEQNISSKINDNKPVKLEKIFINRNSENSSIKIESGPILKKIQATKGKRKASTAKSISQFSKKQKKQHRKEMFKQLIKKNKEIIIDSDEETEVVASDEIGIEIKHGQKLNDSIMMAVMEIMKKQFPHLNGFQDPLMSQKKFKPIDTPGLQMHFIKKKPEHWVASFCGSEIEVYDSAYSYPSESLQKQLHECYSGNKNDLKTLVVNYPNVQQQQDGTSCGLFTIAFVVEKAFGNIPQEVTFAVNKMTDHLIECIEAKRMSPFPRMDIQNDDREWDLVKRLNIYTKCHCNTPSFGKMLECEICSDEFHASCVASNKTIYFDGICYACSKKSIKPKVSHLSRPSGLLNLGNTCYLNSVIQSLSSLQQFWSTISNSNATLNPLLQSFCFLCSQISKGNSISVNPTFFISSFETYFIKNVQDFHLHQEQDAQEFLLYLFDAIFTFLPSFKAKCSSSINSTTTCSVCSSSFESVQIFSTLPIPLCSSINAGIDSLICTEHSNEDNPWFCTNCNTYCIADRSYEISSLPEFFTIQVKRFSFSNNSVTKDDSIVDFHTDDFQLYSNDDGIQLKHNYNLLAFVIHSGSCTTGHYEAAIRRGNQWYLCNDCVVSPIQKEELKKLSPYILFYHLQSS